MSDCTLVTQSGVWPAVQREANQLLEEQHSHVCGRCSQTSDSYLVTQSGVWPAVQRGTNEPMKECMLQYGRCTQCQTVVLLLSLVCVGCSAKGGQPALERVRAAV